MFIGFSIYIYIDIHTYVCEDYRIHLLLFATPLLKCGEARVLATLHYAHHFTFMPSVHQSLSFFHFVPLSLCRTPALICVVAVVSITIWNDRMHCGCKESSIEKTIHSVLLKIVCVKKYIYIYVYVYVHIYIYICVTQNVHFKTCLYFYISARWAFMCSSVI